MVVVVLDIYFDIILFRGREMVFFDSIRRGRKEFFFLGILVNSFFVFLVLKKWNIFLLLLGDGNFFF